MTIDPRKLPDMPELMIAGPGELHEEDLEIMGRQVIAHYGDIWTQVHDETVDALGALLGASDRPYVIPGTGTTCLDAAIFNLFEPGQKVVVANTGYFGDRLVTIARAHRLEVTEVSVDPGAPIDPARIADVASGHDGILSVHVETATGVRHPIEEIAKAAKHADAVYLVDGIASVGGELLDVDKMGLGALVTGSQKGLEAPPGLGIIALGSAGRTRVEARSQRPESWYLDLKTWDTFREEWAAWHPHPVTMPASLILALGSSLQRIAEVGLNMWVKRRAALAKRTRDGLASLGLEQVPQEGVESNLVVAAWAGDPAKIQQHLLSKGLMISGGLAPTHGKAIRVGLMGRTANEQMVDRVLELVAEALEAD